MKIASKLYVSFGIILLILIGFVIFAPIQMNSLSTHLEQFNNKELKTIVLLDEVKDNQNIIARALRNILLTENENVVQKEWQRILESRSNIGQQLEKLKVLLTSEKEREVFSKITGIRQKYIDGQNKIFELSRQGNKQNAVDFLFGDFRNIQNEYFGLSSYLLQEELKMADETLLSGQNLADTSRNILIAVGLVGIVLGLFFASVISKNVSRPINKAVQASERISRGNMNVDLETKSKDETAMLMSAMKKMVENIGSMVDDVKFLAKSAQEGKLDVRADASKYEGDFKELIEGFNGTLDAVIGPLNVAAEYIDRISKGDIPPKITDEYKGDFNEIKNNLNQLIDAINLVVTDSLNLGNALAQGNLDIRTDSSRHQGVFKQIIDTINSAVDNIADPLQETGNVMNFMKDGDLTVRMLGQYAGELQKLKDNFNLMADSISSLLLQISGSADVTASAAAEISAIAETLAASAAENSAQVDEIATAIEEMSRTISENAMGATHAAEVAEKNKQIAIEGGDAVQQTVNKMSEIASVVRASADKIERLGESSKQIGEIISVIDEIADQTNLLALNAAIEAARAGEQGRGFAVVADEVRKLAERTTEATKQIANMIKGIQRETEEAVRAMKQGTEEVNSGILLADKAGNALKQILQSSQEVWDLINQIAAATEEQSSTAEQVAKNVSSISQVTSDTANRVQDIAKSAEDLVKQTDLLRTLLEHFKLRKDQEATYLQGKDTMKLAGKGGRYLSKGEN
ncbi:MAG: methyl-accepting chemotaxis protein [Candidatus Kapaibacteriota bacterium]